MHATHHDPYITACGNDRATPLYDMLIRFQMRERTIKRRIVEAAQLAPGQRLLDIGCGTGTLALIAKRAVPGAAVVGVDGDPKILAIARRKAARERLDVTFDEAMAYALPYADRTFDAVVSSLVFHHLTPEQQVATLNETRRVVRPGGSVVVADFAQPHNRLMRVTPLIRRFLGWSARVQGANRVHGSHGSHGEHVAGHASDAHRIPAAPQAALPERIRAAGFADLRRTARFMTLLGTLAIYTARAPDVSVVSTHTAEHGVALTTP